MDDGYDKKVADFAAFHDQRAEKHRGIAEESESEFAASTDESAKQHHARTAAEARSIEKDSRKKAREARDEGIIGADPGDHEVMLKHAELMSAASRRGKARFVKAIG